MGKIDVIDFETTWLSPRLGDRATEVAAVIVEGDHIICRYHSLMNAGVGIPRLHPTVDRHKQCHAA